MDVRFDFDAILKRVFSVVRVNLTLILVIWFRYRGSSLGISLGYLNRQTRSLILGLFLDVIHIVNAIII